MFRRVTSATRVPAVGALMGAAVVAARSLTYQPRIREYKFLLEDVIDSYSTFNKVGKSDANKELVDSLLDECAKLCTTSLHPLYTTGDDEGCKLQADGTVKTPKGFKDAYKAIVDGGWIGIAYNEKYGGQNMPQTLSIITKEMMGTANWSLAMYPGLSTGAAQTLLAWGNEEQKNVYLPKLVSGEWSGTMCLTEPQCGTDLAQVKTKAEPQADGTYRLTGTKIFISAGDHDMSPNIVHVVLARLPDSKPGTKGLSLFLVPRHVTKSDGSLEEKKNVNCIAVEHKMGIKANATCQLAFENSVGYLIGKESEGMKQMFTFMNGARVGVAVEGVCHAELAFQNGLRYARERGSLRALSGVKVPEKVNDPIIFHPNVRQQLLFTKAIVEGGRALVMDMGRIVDLMEVEEVGSAKWTDLDQEMGFYTPIAKACLTEWGTEAVSRCMQLWGGHGYIKGNGMEQILRDSRISTIYEGTTGIQSLDFIGRKVLRSKTNEVARFGGRVNALVRPLLLSTGPQGKNARRLWAMQKQWRVAITKIGMSAMKDFEAVGAASEDLTMFSGYLVLGYYWLKMAVAAQKHISAGKDADGFYQAKVDTCNFYFERVLPRADGHYAIMQSSHGTLMGSNEASWDLV